MNPDPTLDPTLTSWVPVPKNSPFPIQNLPYGSFTRAGDDGPRLGVAIGDLVFDLAGAARAGMFAASPEVEHVVQAPSLDRLLAAAPTVWTQTRRAISWLLSDKSSPLREESVRSGLFFEQSEVLMQLPFRTHDYADFYSGIEHATTMGKLFRPDSDGLLPQWRHLPMAYHGRASTVKISGTPVTRPHGVRMGEGGQLEFGPSRQLDYEVELGCVVGGQNELGQPTPASAADQRVFGFVLLNDWSARDIQRYEYVPFGPFAGKSFLTSISPWVVSIDALAPWRVHGPTQDPRPQDYLNTDEPWNLNVDLTTRLHTSDYAGATDEGIVVAQANAGSLYWNCAQWLAQVTVSGGIASPGDLLGSGTISGWNADEKGCLAERTANGQTPVLLSDSVVRSMLEDGDTIEITGVCNSNDAAPYSIGFGSVRGTVLPAEPSPN